MSASKREAHTFLTSASTVWVTLIRLGLIVLPVLFSSVSFTNWIYNPSLVSVLIHPHESLPQLEEAHAIRELASDRSQTHFAGFYEANDAIRIPPLVLAVLSKFMETAGSNFRLYLSLFLLLVDLLIAYRIEQIGIRLLDVAFLSSPSNNDKNFSEEHLQRTLPECVQPQFSHIFPIYGPDEKDNETDQLVSKGSPGKEENSSEKIYEPSIPLESLPLFAAQLYYWSPFTTLPSSLFYCWQNIAPFFLVSSLYEAIHSSSPEGSLTMASFYLAVATYLELYHIAYLVPIVLLSSFRDSNLFSLSPSTKWESKFTKPALFVFVIFGFWLLLFHGVSCSLVGPENYWRVLGTVYGNTWLTTSPNLSLQWYFRMQLFSRFRDYFGGMYAGIPFVLVGPLCLRFLRYPGVLVSFDSVWLTPSSMNLFRPSHFCICRVLHLQRLHVLQ